MQEDWEAAEAERQELLRKMRSEAAAAAEQQERAALQVWNLFVAVLMVQGYPACWIGKLYQQQEHQLETCLAALQTGLTDTCPVQQGPMQAPPKWEQKARQLLGCITMVLESLMTMMVKRHHRCTCSSALNVAG